MPNKGGGKSSDLFLLVLEKMKIFLLKLYEAEDKKNMKKKQCSLALLATFLGLMVTASLGSASSGESTGHKDAGTDNLSTSSGRTWHSGATLALTGMMVRIETTETGKGQVGSLEVTPGPLHEVFTADTRSGDSKDSSLTYSSDGGRRGFVGRPALIGKIKITIDSTEASPSVGMSSGAYIGSLSG
jgi:hypothetical protein